MSEPTIGRRKGDGLRPTRREYWTARGVVPRWQFLLVYLVVVVVGIIGFERIGNQSDTAADLARETHSLAQQTAQLARTIQLQRLDGIRRGCEDQNRRHDGTIRALDDVIARVVRDAPERKTELARARAQNVLLINALAPKQDCDRLVRISARPPTP